MSIGLDLGSYELRSLRRRDNNGVLGRKSRAAHAVLPDSASWRRVLGKLDISYAVCEGSLLLVGDTAVEYASEFQTPTLPLMPHSRVPTSDAPARQVLAALIEALLPTPEEPDQICCMTLPGAGRPGGESPDFLVRTVRLKGFQPLIVGRGHAVVLSELVRDSFTGIGVDFGAGTTDISVVHRGVEIDRHTHRRGGEWIDERLAREFGEYTWDGNGNRYLDTDGTRIWKETRGPILEGADERTEFLGELYTELLAELLEDAATAWARNPDVANVPTPLNVVCSGGGSQSPGFDALFRGVLDRSAFPLDVASVRVVADSTYTVARGCLINAELETETQRRNDAA